MSADWSDEEFLGYVEIHCKTDLALFHAKHVARLLPMAGYGLPEGWVSEGFMALHEDRALPLVKQARDKLVVLGAIRAVRTDPQLDQGLTPEQVLQRLEDLNEKFYWLCFKAGVGSYAHPFLEFNGLMSKYIQCLRRTGVDPQEANVHGSEAMCVEDHDIAYMVEKLACIFVPFLRGTPSARKIFEEKFFGEVSPAATTCPVHDNAEHGQEAEELRTGVERLIRHSAKVSQLQDFPENRHKCAVLTDDLQQLLDSVDARDSLAFAERLERRAKQIRKRLGPWSKMFGPLTMNSEGLTLPEWAAAAGKGLSCELDVFQAWERGEDPTEWRANQSRSSE